jgi:GNAT superfamily N-acetyltransferase
MRTINILRKLFKVTTDKYIFYRRIAIVLYDVENYTNNQELKSEKLNISVKRIKTIDKNVESKLQKALSRVDFRPPPFDVEEAKKRLNNNYHFIVLEHNGEFIGWSWDAVGFIYIPELQETITIKDKEAFSFNTYIEKSYRNKGLNKITLHAKIQSLHKEKFRKEWGHIWSWNKPSLKSFTHMGWQIFGYYHYFRFFFLKIRYRAYSKKECSI